VDPTGLAYFAKRPLKGAPWLGPLSSNPIDDRNNTELAHEQLFFEDGKSPANIGFFDDSTLKERRIPRDTAADLAATAIASCGRLSRRRHYGPTVA
jgi:hypothetical protein